MTKQELIQLFGVITILFPQDKRFERANSMIVDTWYEVLADIDIGTAKQAILAHSVNSTYPPTIADIRKYAVKPAVTESAEEAWARVNAALRDGIYHSKERFAELPDVCKRLVGSPSLIQDLAKSESDSSIAAFRSRFMKQYDIEKAQANQQALIPGNVRQALQGAQAVDLAALTEGEG